MKYFLIEEDVRMTGYPRIVHWNEKIDIRDISPKNAHKLPVRELLFVQGNENTVFTDFIFKPFFLVSEKVKKVLKMYEPTLITKELVLLDQVYERTERYFLPVFEEVECLAKQTTYNLDHSELKHIVLEAEIVKNYSIFRIANFRKQYIVSNLDVVESILKRGCESFQLTELEMEN